MFMPRRMRDAELRKSRLGRLPLAPSAGVSVCQGRRQGVVRERQGRTVEHSDVAERVVRVVEVESGPNGARRQRELLGSQICESIVSFSMRGCDR